MDITNAELARRLTDFRVETQSDLGEIKNHLDKLVPREVYDAQRTAAERQVSALETRIAALEGRARWLIGTLVIPVVIVIIQWLLAAKGVRP